MEPLHPAPVDQYRTDHRSTANRQQMREPTDYQTLWRRAVEGLAAELQMEPIDAHFELMRASGYVTKGQAWEWWT